MECNVRGNINAPIMLIGECPGKDEINNAMKGTDEHGEFNMPMPIPFCGKAGRLLHMMIHWADINEGEFILTNAYKKACFRPNGWARTPDEAELLEHRERLLLEISKVDPKLIITLGVGPIWDICYHEKSAKDELRVGKLNGRLHKAVIHGKEYEVLPLYHPSAILRDKDGERGYKKEVTEALTRHKSLIMKVLGRVPL